MTTEIVRFNDRLKTLTFTSSDSTTEGFNMAVYAGAMIMVESLDGGATTLSWKCRTRSDGATTFVACDKTNTPLTTTVAAGRAYAVPDELFGAAFVVVTTNAGTAVCRVTVKG